MTYVLNTEQGLMELDLPLPCPICSQDVGPRDFIEGNAFLLTGQIDVAAHVEHFYERVGGRGAVVCQRDNYNEAMLTLSRAYAEANGLKKSGRKA
jgi:hypothetical protein